MRIYTTMGPQILFKTNAELSEQFDAREVPDYTIRDGRWLRRGVAGVYGETYTFDLTLFAWPDNLHAPSRPMNSHRRTDLPEGVYAATWDQWGVWLATAFDVCADAGEQIRVTGAYDVCGKNAPSEFHTSAGLFGARTMGQYQRMHRQRGLDMSCTRHKWEFMGQYHECYKCGRTYRFRIF